MKKYLLLLTIVSLVACNKTNKKLKETITGSDSIVINYFKGDGTMDTVVKVKTVRDRQTITALSNEISAATTKVDYKCGFDGSLHFFGKNVVILDIDFRMNEANCMYFTFKQNGETGATKLSENAKKILTEIAK